MIGKRVQKLLSLWLVLGLILAPLPAFSAAFASPTPAMGHCRLMQMPTSYELMQAASMQPVMAGCPHCKQDCQGQHCQGDDCNAGNCSPCHGSVTFLLPATDLLQIHASQILLSQSAAGSISRTDPPLLRPPLLLCS